MLWIFCYVFFAVFSILKIPTLNILNPEQSITVRLKYDDTHSDQSDHLAELIKLLFNNKLHAQTFPTTYLFVITVRLKYDDTHMYFRWTFDSRISTFRLESVPEPFVISANSSVRLMTCLLHA